MIAMVGNALLLALRELRRNVMRSILTMLGIIIGVASVIILVTLGNGATKKVTQQIASLGSNLLKRTSAIENVELPLIYRHTGARRHAQARQAFQQVGLTGWEHHTPGELSGGQQQRVAIARAIVTQPTVLLADEPTGNLDSARSVEIMELLTSLNRDQGITIVMVTHEPDMAAFAKRIVHFKDGLIENDHSDEEEPV